MPVKTYPLQPQYDDALTEAGIAEQEGYQLDPNQVPENYTYQQFVPSAQDLQGPALMEQYARAQQEALLAQQMGIDQAKKNLDQMRGQETGVNLSPLMALADAWATGPSNLAQSYKAPMSEREKNAQIMGLQEKLQAARDKQTDNRTQALSAAIRAYSAGKVDPKQQEERQSRIDLNRAMMGIRTDKAGEVKDFQALSAGYGKRMMGAEDIFSQLEKQGYNRAELGSEAGAALPGMVQSPFTKQQSQAERNFVNAVLRRESGAAISPSEFSSAEKQYFPRAGDDPQTLANKRANRQQAVESMRVAAGKAWDKTGLIKASPAVDEIRRKIQQLQQKAGQ